MSDSNRLHASCLSILDSKLAGENHRNLDTLAWAITGLFLQKTINLSAWVSSVPHEIDASGREQRFRRWLNNSAVNVRKLYQPFITCALADWPGHTMYVGLDTTSVTEQLVLVQTAVLYRRRAIPLAWQALKSRSVMLAFEQYAELIEYTATLIPSGVTVIALGDRGFRDVRLMALLRKLGWHFRLRLTEKECVWIDRQRCGLESWALLPYQPCFLQDVLLTDKQYGPVSIAMTWNGDVKHDPWRIASDQQANPNTFSDYALRMGIDANFLDEKSAGFQLDDTGLLSPVRLNHLLLVMAWCSLYLTSLGIRLVASGQRRLIDTHWQRRLSYLQLGWRWLDYVLASDAPLPIAFYLDPAPDPEPLVNSTKDEKY
jgi:hypothetical protein